MTGVLQPETPPRPGSSPAGAVVGRPIGADRRRAAAVADASTCRGCRGFAYRGSRIRRGGGLGMWTVASARASSLNRPSRWRRRRPPSSLAFGAGARQARRSSTDEGVARAGLSEPRSADARETKAPATSTGSSGERGSGAEVSTGAGPERKRRPRGRGDRVDPVSLGPADCRDRAASRMRGGRQERGHATSGLTSSPELVYSEVGAPAASADAEASRATSRSAKPALGVSPQSCDRRVRLVGISLSRFSALRGGGASHRAAARVSSPISRGDGDVARAITRLSGVGSSRRAARSRSAMRRSWGSPRSPACSRERRCSSA
jgi:hypothetical protein